MTFIIAAALLLWNRFKLYIVSALAILIFIVTVFFKGVSHGKRKYTERRERAKARAKSNAEKIRERNRKLPDSDIDHELAEWMRDPSDL